jgi:hypothetical protein
LRRRNIGKTPDAIMRVRRLRTVEGFQRAALLLRPPP